MVFCPSDTESGELRINNHTDANVGRYVCEARNAVGRAQCDSTLHAYQRKSGSFRASLLHLQRFSKFCQLQIFAQLTCCRQSVSEAPLEGPRSHIYHINKSEATRSRGAAGELYGTDPVE